MATMSSIGQGNRLNTATRMLLTEKRKTKRNARNKLNHVRRQVKRDARQKSRQRLKYHRKTLNWTLDTIIQVIRDKILGRIRRAEETYVVAYKMLECPVQGINRRHLQEVMKRRFGLVLTKDEVNLIFDRYDTDRSDLLDFNEFIRGVLPADYLEIPPLTKHALEMTKKKKPFLPDQPVFHQHFDGQFRPNVDEIERQIRDKILARTRDASSQYRIAFQMFGRTNRITKNRFHRVCQRWGIHLKQQEMDALFRRYDTDNSGYLEFNELIFNVLPKDFPQKGPWYYKRAKGIERQRLAKKYNVPVHLLEKHLERKGMLTRQAEREKNLKRFVNATKGANGKIQLNDSLSINGSNYSNNVNNFIENAWGEENKEKEENSILNTNDWGFHSSSNYHQNHDGDDNVPIEMMKKTQFDRLLRTAQSRGRRKKIQENAKKLRHTKANDPFLWKYKDYRDEPQVKIRNMRPGQNYKTWKRPQTTFEHVRSPHNKNNISNRDDIDQNKNNISSEMILGKSLQISPVKSRNNNYNYDVSIRNNKKNNSSRPRPSTVGSSMMVSSRPVSNYDSYKKGFNAAFNTILNVAATNDQERRQYAHLMKTASKPDFQMTNRYRIC